MSDLTSQKICLEDVATYPLPGMAIPTALSFSSDDKLIAYLHSSERTLTQQLYVFDAESGQSEAFVQPLAGGDTEATLSPEEKLRRERARARALGITRYAWQPRTQQMLIPLNGELYVRLAGEDALLKIVDNCAGPVLDPQCSPDGAWIAYVQDAELCVVPFAGGASRQLTSGARGTGRTQGLAEYAAQEEMGRRHGFWWSKDSAWLAFAAVDETHIPRYRIMHQGKDAVGADAQEDHAYPFAGQANAKVRLAVLPLAGGDPLWLDIEADEELYLARVQWDGADSLLVQLQNREQSVLRLWRFDVRSGERVNLLTETSTVWVNLHHMLLPLKRGGFVWASERSGFMHLYLYDGDGNLLRPLTEGAWMVDAVVGVDERRGQLYFTATEAHPTERHLYVVSLEGGAPRQVTQTSGMHTPVLDHACERFIDVWHSPTQPPTITLRSIADNALLGTIFNAPDPRVAALGVQPPEQIEFQSRDGETLYAALYVPPAERFGAGPYPVIVSVYGGPHVQKVTRSWSMSVDMRAQYLRDAGYLVLKVDNRGSARRGLAFEGALKHHMGGVEVRDQVDGVRWLVEQGLADAARVGIYGWSYGGYMALRCLACEPEMFKVAVAGAPVTFWDGYDTHYTERYMGLPSVNAEGYRESSIPAYVENLRGKLLLIHGLIDENVHFRHTARLINALIRAHKPYDLLLFPNERHMPRGLADRIYMEERIHDYFLTNL